MSKRVVAQLEQLRCKTLDCKYRLNALLKSGSVTNPDSITLFTRMVEELAEDEKAYDSAIDILLED